MTATDLGRVGYNAYGEAVGWKTHDDKPMPHWDALGDVQKRWEAAAHAIVHAACAEPKATADQAPPVGAVVTYRLTEQDAQEINKRRADANRHRRDNPDEQNGYLAHVGNTVRAGDTYPAVVVRTFDPKSTTANLQVLLDGNDTYWATSRQAGDTDAEGRWH